MQNRNEAVAWCPQLRYKPHALVPGKSVYGPNEHPYAAEIAATDALGWIPANGQPCESAAAAVAVELPVVRVESAAGVSDMVQVLEQQQEVAIDCEMDARCANAFASSRPSARLYTSQICTHEPAHWGVESCVTTHHITKHTDHLL